MRGRRSASPAPRSMRALLRTDPHLIVSRLVGDPGRQPRNGWRRRAPAGRLAVKRQADRNAGALAQPARNLHATAVQRQEPLDDRKTETGPIVMPVIRGACLEK